MPITAELRGRGGVAARSLTDAAVRALPPGADVGDAAEPGLRVRVAPDGKRRTFSYRHRDAAGALRKITLGAYGAGPGRLSLAQARDRVRELKKLRVEVGGAVADHLEARAAAAAAEAKAATTQARADAYTVRVLAGQYVEARRDLDSIREIDRCLRKYVMPKLGDLPVAEVRVPAVFGALGPLARKHPVQARLALAALRQALTWAVGEGRLETNPLIGAKPPWGKAHKGERWLKPGEVGRFVRRLPESGLKADEQGALRLQLLTGCRVGEAVGAAWREVDLRARTWTLPPERSKNDREHVVYLSTQARDLLLALPSRGKADALFPRDSVGGHLRVDMATKVLRAALPELGLAGVTTHTLRHTVSTHLARLGFGREVRDRVTNHTPQGIDATYTHHRFDEEARKAWQAWADEIDRLVTLADGGGGESAEGAGGA